MTATSDGRSRTALPWPLCALVGVLAFAMRLVPVLRGGGLHGSMSYDGSVYYAASAGLAHGLLPYKDFLLLHPPGIAVALLPFTLAAKVIGDANGMAAAHVATMALGGVNAVLVMRILRANGVAAALIGGVAYAVLYPAVYLERAVALEAPAATCLLGAMLLASRWSRSSPRARSTWWAGVLLGLSCTLKIWGVVPFAAVLIWAVATVGWRRALPVVAGAATAGVVVCGPFLLLAGRPMWRMVVADQIGRRPMPRGPFFRFAEISGVSVLPHGTTTAVVVAAAVVVGLVCVLACRTRTGRLGVVLLAATVGLLMLTPSWFLHYAGLSAAPLAVVLGAAASPPPLALSRWRTAAAALALLGLAAYAVPVATTTFGTRFPAARLAAAAVRLPGCVTTDDPTALIETDVLQRNLDRGCPLVVDLGGYSYDLANRGHAQVTREHNRAWQGVALDYLGSGSATIVMRFYAGYGFNRRTAAVVESWPVITRAGRYTVRQPPLGALRSGGR